MLGAMAWVIIGEKLMPGVGIMSRATNSGDRCIVRGNGTAKGKDGGITNARG